MAITRIFDKPTIGGSGKPNPTPPPTHTSFAKYVQNLWKIFIGFWIFLVAVFLAATIGIFGEMPSFIDLESPKSALASEVYSADNELLGKFYITNRSNTTYNEIPKHVVDALIATEDVRFNSHSGIDFRGIFRVLLRTVLMGDESSGGGSTITQQLAKNLFHDKPSSIFMRILQKAKEWIIAIKLEKSYTKEEIITMYLNTVPFSENTHGIKSAAHTYFACPPDSLKIEEGAILVGMLKGSTKYNPKINPNNALERRNVVLDQMAKYGKISQADAQAIQKLPLKLKYSRTDHNEGLATYFREYLRSYMKDWAKNNIKVDGTSYDIYRDGLRIYTTINAKMQAYAEAAVTEQMRDLQKTFYGHWKEKTPWFDSPLVEKIASYKIKKGDPWFGTPELLYRAVKQSERYNVMKDTKKYSEKEIENIFKTPIQMSLFAWKGDRDTTLSPFDSIKYVKYLLHTGFMAMDPQSGNILTWVGGINFKHFKYDNVRPSSKRQVGSTFKPFVYTVAVQNGWSPCRTVPNLPVVFENYQGWSPENATNYLEGQMVSLRTGLAHSINRITAYLIKQIGTEPVINLAQKMGIDSHIDNVPSICLGTADISLYEMVGAYCTFANKGFYTKPRCIQRIEDKSGNVIQAFPSSKQEAINEQTAYAMIYLLKGVTDYGTGRRLRGKYGLVAEIAGKTGTTNDNSDGWYIGMTPKVVAGAWVGGDEKAIHFRSTQLGSGSNMALPIFGLFMKKVYADSTLHIKQTDYFERPLTMGIELNCDSYANPSSTTTEEGGNSLPTNDPKATQKDDFDYNNQFD